MNALISAGLTTVIGIILFPPFKEVVDYLYEITDSLVTLPDWGDAWFQSLPYVILFGLLFGGFYTLVSKIRNRGGEAGQ